MRYDADHKQQTRERVLREAAKAIRAEGPHQIAVAGIIARCGPANIENPVEKTSGTMAPPTKPWMTRKAIIDWMSQAMPQRALAAVKRPADITNSQRVDRDWARKAAKGIITSSAIR